VVTVYGAPPRLAFPENATLRLSGIAHAQRDTLAFLDDVRATCSSCVPSLRCLDPALAVASSQDRNGTTS
jgi:hypothetical protein